MPQRRVTANNDECRVWWDGAAFHFDFAHHETIPGYVVFDIYKSSYGMIFRDLAIPIGTLIQTARVAFSAFGPTPNDIVNTHIQGEKNPNPAPFTDLADYQARTWTTAKIPWDNIQHWQDAMFYNTPELKAIIQEIVDLPTWDSGKDIALFWHDLDDRSTHIDYTTRMAETHHHEPSRAPKLYVAFLSDPTLESYTTGGDSLQDLGGAWYAGQSFTPQTTHTLRHIDINLRNYHPTRAPTVWLYLAGEDHKPTGDYLSKTYRSYSDNWNIYNVFRMRADMQPVEVLRDTEYVIVIHSFALDLSWQQQWQYDSGDATYPRGNRLRSSNYGATWTRYLNDDHIFAEFGTPPVPEPPPPPPVYHWAIIDIEQIVTATGYKIIATTNVPCHLFMYWTATEPEKHDRTTVRRGLTVPAATQYCFVVWHQNEQEEPGDTITHTFIKEPWPVCETRWFTFRATTDNDWSPSVGPIFKKHRTAAPPPPPPPIYYPDPDPETSSVDGKVGNLPAFQTWAQIRDGAGTFGTSSLPGILARIRRSGSAPPNNFYDMYRGIFLYDMTAAIGNTALSATIKLYGSAKRNRFFPNTTYNIFASAPATNTDLIPADYNSVSDTPLATPLTYAEIVLNAWNTWTLNVAGIALINAVLAGDGILKLSFREATFDAPNIEPLPGIRNRYVWVGCADADTVPPRPPPLEVVWV